MDADLPIRSPIILPLSLCVLCDQAFDLRPTSTDRVIVKFVNSDLVRCSRSHNAKQEPEWPTIVSLHRLQVDRCLPVVAVIFRAPLPNIGVRIACRFQVDNQPFRWNHAIGLALDANRILALDKVLHFIATLVNLFCTRRHNRQKVRMRLKRFGDLD